MEKHNGSNRNPCSMCGQKRGSWKSDYCPGKAASPAQPVQEQATQKQVDFLKKLIADDYSQATTFGLQNINVASMSKTYASQAIDQMLNS